MTKAEIEQRAKELYWAQSLAWSGNKWDWSKASEDVKEKFRAHASAGTRPPLPAEI